MTAKIRNPEVLKEWASEWLNTVTLDIFDKTQQNLDNMDVNYTGQLKKSGIFDLNEKLHKKITYNTSYAVAVEFGQDAHFVPIEPLKKWVRIKTGKDESFAYYVQKKIMQEGTEGYFFVSAAMTYIKEQYRR